MTRPRRIGLALERESVFARQVLQGMAAAVPELERSGFPVDLRFLPDRLVRDAADLRGFDGFVAQVQSGTMAARLTATRKPVVDVLFKRSYPYCTVVNVDNRAIAELAVEHLLERQFRTFAFCGRDGVSYSDGRFAAFAAALKARGRDVLRFTIPARQADRIYLGRVPDETVDAPADAAYLRKWAARLPAGTAVFCCQDLRAYQLMRACRAAGRRIPDEIAVLGVDDDPIFCNFTDPRLSSVDPDAAAVGRAALLALREDILGRRRVKSPAPRFVRPRGLTVRESTDVFHYEPKWLGDALGFIHRNIAANLSAEDVFRHVGKSHTLVDRAFRTALGTSVQKEIMRLRLARATELLTSTDLPIRDVARASGFASFSYFCSSFAAAHGMSAAAYRAHNPSLYKPNPKLL